MGVLFKEKTAIQPVEEEYNIVEDTNDVLASMSPEELNRLTSMIAIDDTATIVGFGADAAEEISKASDVVLNSMNMEQLNDSGELLKSLTRIMANFDIKEIKENPKGLKKLFYNAKHHIEVILDKYSSMGNEVEKIYVQLKEYEKEINDANTKLDALFDSNVQYYHDLIRYIAAGEKACEEVEGYIQEKQDEYIKTGDTELQFEIQNYQQGLDALRARVMDLRMAQNVAMQAVPMIKTMAYSNMHLVRKINSAFIVTLPVFKQSLAQAMMLKRQKVQADSLDELDQKTNEMLLKNAENTVAQSKMITKLATSSSVSIETLEKTWQTISKGIDETNKIRAEANAKYEDQKRRLSTIKRDFDHKYALPNKSA